MIDYRKLKKTRKLVRLRQQAVADYLGISRTALSNMENGISKITADDFMKLCNLYRCEPYHFYEPENKKEKNDER